MLKTLHAELDRGLRTSSAYTVQKAVDDWLEGGLPGRSERTRSVYREALAPLVGQIGNKPLKELTAGDVRAGLEALSDRLSIRYLQIAKASLARAIRFAEAHDRVGRNVATLVDPPKGAVGRPSRSLTLEQSLAVLAAARESRLNAYIVLSLTVGIRTEEARAVARPGQSGRCARSRPHAALRQPARDPREPPLCLFSEPDKYGTTAKVKL